MKIKIEIITSANSYVVFANTLTCELWVNGNHFQVADADGFIVSAIEIVKDWPDIIENPSVSDGIKYTIAYDDDNIERVIVGNNAAPKNFGMLMDLIRQINPEIKLEREIKSEYNKVKKMLKSRGN